MTKALTQAQLNQVAGLSSREAGKILGVAKSSINKYREIARQNGGELPIGDSENHKVLHATDAPDGARTVLETRADGSLTVEVAADVPQDKEQIDAAMIRRGFDPEEYTFNYRFSEWQANIGGGELITMYAARASATPKPVRNSKLAAALNTDELLETVSNWTFTPVIREAYASADMVTMFADPQLGKVDENGGSAETVNQILQSFANLAEIAKQEKPHDILFGDLGDGLENFYNTSVQAQTNDLELTEQVRVLRRVQAEGIRMLAPLCKRLRHRSVNSNHGGVRIAPQQLASTVSNDWGLEVSHQLEDVFAESAITNVDFGRPDGKHAVSLDILLENGTAIGMSHGDQAGTQARLGTWWMGQAFGWKNPLRDVDILLVGHFHNQYVEEVFEGRHLIVGAASDRGSSWYTNRTGRSASSGITTFMTADRKHWSLQLV